MDQWPARRRRWVAIERRWAGSQRVGAVAATILGVAAMIETILRTVAASDGPFYAVVLCLLALCTTLPLALPRPSVAAIAIAAANLLSLMPFQTLTVAGFGAQLIAAYRLGRIGPQFLAIWLALPFLVLALTDSQDTVSRTPTLVLAALTPAAALAGAAMRTHDQTRQYDAAKEDILETLLEHTARGERARIARELHDVVAHHVSMIAVQAETARLTTPGMPAAGAQRLSQIGDTARAALTEMRRLLGVLREDAPTEAVQRDPQPGLYQLNDLIDEARTASGAATRLIMRGSLAAVDPGVELAAYRIVQEALTNARRHAPGAAVDVELTYTDGALQVRIRDNGPGPSPMTTAAQMRGHGVLGMHERAAAVGGRLQTGPAAGGGFFVETVLPTTAASSR